MRDWLNTYAAKGEPVAVAMTGAWSNNKGCINRIALSEPGGSFISVDWDYLDKADLRAVRRWLEGDYPKIMHDWKVPLLVLRHYGIEPKGMLIDTAVMTYLLHPEWSDYPLPAGSLCDISQEKEDAVAASLGQIPMLGTASSHAALGTMVNFNQLAPKLPGAGAEELEETMERPMVQILANMQYEGIAVDTDYLTNLYAGYCLDAGKALDKAYSLVGDKYNLGSPKQLQELLYDDLRMPELKETNSGGYSTDAETLKNLLEITGHPVLEAILEHREAIKRKGTVEGLIRETADDGRVHSTLNQLVTTTGRLSSSDPNLQNVPARTEEGKRIRGAFCKGPGYDGLFTADYSVLELRILAHLSNDQELISAFTSGEDLHTSVASKVFDVAPEDVDGELRFRVKMVSYGLCYGMSAVGLSTRLKVPQAEAQRLMDDYFNRFGGIKQYLQTVVEAARIDGYTQTLFGRRRYLPDLNSRNKYQRSAAERQAQNAPVQGSAADIVKVAMIRVDKGLKEQGCKSRMLLQIHDEIIVEVAPGERDTVERVVREGMLGAYDLRAPLEISTGYGRTWAEASH